MFVAENLSVLLYQGMENIPYTPMVARGLLRHYFLHLKHHRLHPPLEKSLIERVMQ